MVSTVKLPILKKGEYTLWSMRMEQYLTNTDYSLWQVILNGDGPIQVTTNENGVETKVPPKTAQALLQRQRERKAKSILLLAIPDEPNSSGTSSSSSYTDDLMEVGTKKSREQEWRCGYRSRDNTRKGLYQWRPLMHWLESIEAQLVVHQKNEVVYEEKIKVLEFEVKDKSNDITRLKKQLDETLREKYDLKLN
ncbi:hypothetical protein Tco_1522783 [Tanacetum coccineum]